MIFFKNGEDFTSTLAVATGRLPWQYEGYINKTHIWVSRSCEKAYLHLEWLQDPFWIIQNSSKNFLSKININ